ncbi:hypothetical protein ESCO_006446 [Escovopsis weberi]|uniref:F-box domain-containing protein n=1 Tax=Escovopsis weberi TaxID=150374 RepID=A0A0M8N0G6_ESCWE|nr:hypothetical protein ESCO_006446 [Escovopsis weberi]
MSASSFGSLPDDIILEIIRQLPTARDVAHFAASSRWTHRVARERGWQDFVRARFSSLRLPRDTGGAGTVGAWDALADRLTYQDRCWNRRGFAFTQYGDVPAAAPSARPPRRPHRGQSVMFESVLAASTATATAAGGPREELLVCGAGEDIHLRRRATASRRPTDELFTTLRGREMGYAPGVGDVTAAAIIERGAGVAPEVVIGRADGDLQLISADAETLGASTQGLVSERQTTGLRRSPGQMAISWAEWEPKTQVLASCRGSCLTLHNLGDREEPTLRPVVHFDVADTNPADEISLLRSIKFMGPDAVACAMGGCRQPLKRAQLRPEGLEFDDSKTSRDGEKTTVRAIEPVFGRNPNLLLSAWDDGGHRLSDFRTPNAFDALYRDRFEPYQASSSMIVYGSERFVTGIHSEPGIRLFDFRFPRPYQHFAALPCSPHAPTPARPVQMSSGAYDAGARGEPQPPVPRCDFASGWRCSWHEASAQPSWQPDATLDLGRPAFDRVCSLAKSADTSSSFYVGVRGAMLEVGLTLAGDSLRPMSSCLPETKRDSLEGWRATCLYDGVSLIESGIGRCEEEEVEELTGMPNLYSYEPLPAGGMFPKWSRLDRAFHEKQRGARA